MHGKEFPWCCLGGSVVLCVLGGLWYLAEPFFLLYKLLREMRETDPLRSIGQEKTHLQHVATAAALNMVRSMAWFNGFLRAQTRRSAFVCLYDTV